MKNCERCGNSIDETTLGKWATGRFCSRKCANTRHWTDEHKHKVSISCKTSEKLKAVHLRRSASKKEHTCEICTTKFTDFLRKGRRVLCKNCRRKNTKNFDGTPESFYKLSARTRSKIVKRMKLGCSNCKWNAGTLDIHHIIERKNGGPNSLDNLSPVCPNCHRLVHEGKLKRTDIKSLAELEMTFNWIEYYYPDKAGI